MCKTILCFLKNIYIVSWSNQKIWILHQERKVSKKPGTGVCGKGTGGRPQPRSAGGSVSTDYMNDSSHAHCRSQSTGRMVGRLSGSMSVEDIVRSKELSPLQSSAKVY